jgi:N-acetylglutamate synthase-like GNAT family acetyltransferase
LTPVPNAASRHLRIRDAALADAARIADLSAQLGYPSSTEQALVRLGTVLQNGMHAVCVAENEDGVVGWVHVHEHLSVCQDRVAEVIGLVVAANWRGAGMGKCLIEAAEKWARRKGLSAIVLRSNVIREAAHRFYERLGYTRIKTQHVLGKSL